jgi:hypothetical protein
MKKHTLSLIGVAAAALFATGVQAVGANSNLPFEFNRFMATKKPANTVMITKEEYMAEMEHRWMMADKMMGANAGKGVVSQRMLMKAMRNPSPRVPGAAK